MTKPKEDGIFPIQEKMPCKPRQIKIDPYTLPIVFDSNLEAEEATARLVWFSRQCKEWVGVSWQRILAMMKADIVVNDRRLEQKRSSQQAHRLWFSLWLLKGKQKELTAPISGIYTYTFGFVRRGIRFLLDGHWIRQEVHDDNIVYFPTPKLIKRIMRKHSIQTK